MNGNDYVLLFDKNGEAYIAHANIKDSIRSSYQRVRKNAKYIKKIVKDGKTRYFYDQKEWDAYVRGEKGRPTTLIGKVKDSLEIDKRDRFKAADKEYWEARRKQQDALGKSHDSLGEAAKSRDRYDSSAHAQAAKDRANKDYSDLQKANDELKKADKKALDAKNDYDKTKLSKLEKFAEHPVKKTAEAIDDTVDNAVWTAEDAINKIRDKRKQKAMNKDPKVVSARTNRETAKREYERVYANIKDYCEASGINYTNLLNGRTDDPFAKKLKDQYWKANDALRKADLDYYTAAKKYGAKLEFSSHD